MSAALRKRTLDFTEQLLITAGAVTDDKRAYYRNINFGTKVWERNPNCWAASLDLSGCAVYHDIPQLDQDDGLGTLVTPQHFIASAHWSVQENIGGSMYWVGSDGVTYARQVVDTDGHSVLNGGDDHFIGKLNAPLPAVCKPFKVLPRNWLDYFPSDPQSYLPPGGTWDESPGIAFPVLHFNRARLAGEPVDYPPYHSSRWCVIRQAYSLERGGSSFAGGLSLTSTFDRPWKQLYLNWAHLVANGDSSTPVFLILAGGELIPIYTMTSASSGPGPGFFRTYYNQQIVAMGDTGHRVEEVDLKPYAAMMPVLREQLQSLIGAQ